MTAGTSRRETNRILRRGGIVALAREAFLEGGYAATSMSTIAAELGGSKGTLWAHFPSKEALFAAVLDDLTLAFRAELEDALKPGRDPRTTLTGFADRFLAKILAPPSVRLQRLIVAEAGRSPEVGRLFYERGPRQVLGGLETYLVGADRGGHLHVADPAAAARHLVGLLQTVQLSLLWNVADTDAVPDVQDYATGVVDMFLRAYAPSSDRTGR